MLYILKIFFIFKIIKNFNFYIFLISLFYYIYMIFYINGWERGAPPTPLPSGTDIIRIQDYLFREL